MCSINRYFIIKKFVFFLFYCLVNQIQTQLLFLCSMNSLSSVNILIVSKMNSVLTMFNLLVPFYKLLIIRKLLVITVSVKTCVKVSFYTEACCSYRIAFPVKNRDMFMIGVWKSGYLNFQCKNRVSEEFFIMHFDF